MKPIITRFILLFLMGVFTPTIMAAPVVAIDLDSGTAGIQSSLSVLSGTVLSASLVAYDDGTGGSSLIGTVGADVSSSDTGVASLGLTATAGSFANFFAAAVDAATFNPVFSGTILTPISPPATAATLGSVGYLDFNVVGALLPSGAASFIDLINFSITAGLAGISTLGATDSSLADTNGATVFEPPVTALLTVTSAGGSSNNIPEPSILWLMMMGWLGLSARRLFKEIKS